MDEVSHLWRELYEKGGKENLQRLLELDPSQAKAMRYEVSLLHLAAGSGYLDVVFLLLRLGADVNSVDWFDDTPLHRAASGSKPEVCRILLEYCASTTAVNRLGRTPLDCARLGDIWAWREDYELTIKLLEDAGQSEHGD